MREQEQVCGRLVLQYLGICLTMSIPSFIHVRILYILQSNIYVHMCMSMCISLTHFNSFSGAETRNRSDDNVIQFLCVLSRVSVTECQDVTYIMSYNVDSGFTCFSLVRFGSDPGISVG